MAKGTVNRYGRQSRLELVACQSRTGKTVLPHIYATQPFRVMKPFTTIGSTSHVAQVIVMSSSAGLMEGDEQVERIEVGPGAAISVRAQAFDKVHRMDGLGRATRDVTLRVATSAQAFFLQQPVIPFARSRFKGSTLIELADRTAAVAYGEVIACGRVARDERFAFTYFANRILLTVDGTPLFGDNLVLDPDEEDLSGLGMFEGHTHAASLVLTAPWLSEEGFIAARSWLAEEIEEHGNSIGGITHLGMVKGASGWAVRLLGDRADQLQSTLAHLAHMAGFTVPARTEEVC